MGDELHVTVIATGVGESVPERKKLVQVTVPGNIQPDNNPEPRIEETRSGNSQPAPANPSQGSSLFPSSNFSGLDNHAISSGETSQSGKATKPWNEEYMETPTYLRKKAN
jgi:cell division protein FtsZ